MKITLHNSNALILGYGRIGKILAKMLQGIGANTYICARKYSDAAMIKSYGYHYLSYSELTENLQKMDLIVNTVPSILLDKTNLKFIDEDCLLIDLASKPFGIDMEESKKEGLNVMWAPSLPGKVAPITAAIYIKETVYNIIEKLVESI